MMGNDEVSFAEHPFFGVLKRVVLQRNPESRAATGADVQQALRFFVVPSGMDAALRSASIWARKAPAAQADFEALLSVSAPSQVQMSLDLQVKAAVAQLLSCPEGLQLVYPQVLLDSAAQLGFERLLAAAQSVPGQRSVAAALACDVAQQLAQQQADPARATAARVLLHADADVARAMAQALAGCLREHEGYAVLEIDCANYRSEGEASSWTGSKSYWSGSAPGEITAFVAKNPKAVVVLHHLDETLASVMASIRDAFAQGQLVDNHGIHPSADTDGRKNRKGLGPTVVDCRRAVFVATVSEGQHWLTHPDHEAVLGTQTRQRQQQLLALLQSHKREHRGEVLPVFERGVLQAFSTHHHVLTPLVWPDLRALARANMGAALSQCVQGACKEAQLEVLTDLALWSHGGQAAMRHTSAQALRDALLGEQVAQLWASDNTPRAQSLRLGPQAVATHAHLKAQLGLEPVRAWERLGQYARLCWVYASLQGQWVLESVQTEVVRDVRDYAGGAGGLRAHVPSQTLADVAGHESAKAYFREVVGHLRDAKSLQALGVQPPKGVMLYGKPGTGKTLLARALAGEAGLPFLSITGTELCDTRAIDKLYEVARRNAPCLVHVDEADAIGQRGHSPAQDKAINFLLSQIDGFEQCEGIFHVLTTNRPDALDDALLRPGRIDRRLEIGSLDAGGREQALAWLWPLLGGQVLDAAGPAVSAVSALTESASDVSDFKKRVLQLTFGMTGAELAQLRRELALRQLREGAAGLNVAWVLEEVSRLQWGDSHGRHSDDGFRHRVAVHEAGHALVQHVLLPHVPIAQVSITPREGSAGFVASNFEQATRLDETPAAVRAFLCMLLGGRAAEVLVFGAEGPSNGAASDLARASEAAFKAVAFGGLDEAWGAVSLLGLTFKGVPPAHWHDAAAERVRVWVEQAQAQAQLCLQSHRAALDALVQALLAQETLDGAEVARLVHAHASQRLLALA